jgi:ribosomal protein S18 acetylase RimI-like enzyme
MLQGILAAGLTGMNGRYSIHPGDLAWWVYHDDPRFPDHFSVWIQGEDAFVVIETREPREIVVFARPGVDRWGLIDWAQRRVGGDVEVGWIADTDQEMADWLGSHGYRQTYSFRSYEFDPTGDLPTSPAPEGWELRALQGEHEADTRRAASHAAFESKMAPDVHLGRYLGLMRSPVYVLDQDLVAVDSDGRVGAFMIWWADPSGVAQIEPFGTHPDFHRRGLGRALIHHGLAEMKTAGMSLARVCTDDDRQPANQFYEACGFVEVGRLWWWAPDAATPLQDI